MLINDVGNDDDDDDAGDDDGEDDYDDGNGWWWWWWWSLNFFLKKLILIKTGRWLTSMQNYTAYRDKTIFFCLKLGNKANMQKVFLPVKRKSKHLNACHLSKWQKIPKRSLDFNPLFTDGFFHTDRYNKVWMVLFVAGVQILKSNPKQIVYTLMSL